MKSKIHRLSNFTFQQAILILDNKLGFLSYDPWMI